MVRDVWQRGQFWHEPFRQLAVSGDENTHQQSVCRVANDGVAVFSGKRMTTPPAPARLFVLLAREAPVGVILRRGPSQWVQLIKWNTDTDAFEPGQWFKGRIYERECDLSPDGKLLLYFAYKGGNWSKNPDYTSSWTAISKPPYFTALALWPFGDTRGGGGRFRDNKSIWLHRRDAEPHPNHLPKGIEVIAPNEGLDDQGLRKEIERTSWTLRQRGQITREIQPGLEVSELFNQIRKDWWITKLDPPTTTQKRGDSYVLIQKYLGLRRHYGAVYEYSIIDNQNREIKVEGATCLDFDQPGRIIIAKAGKLYTAAITDQGELALTEIADFNANKPEPVETPDWAKKW